MYMILFVLDDPDQLDDLLERWYAVGVRGATIIESTGINRRRNKNTPHMRYFFQSPGHLEEGHYTLVAIVPGEEMVQAVLQASEELVGDLDLPNTGVFAAWPLTHVKGVPPVNSPVDN